MQDDLAKIRRLPLFADCGDIACNLLPEGRTNHNYRVRAGGRDYFVRLSAVAHKEHGIDRKKEYLAIRNLHAIGLGPRPLHFCATSDIIVTEFIDAPNWTLETVKAPAALSCFGAAIAALHRMPDNGNTYDIVQITARYIDGLRNSNVAAASTLDFLNDIRLRVAAIVDPRDFGMCHNDLWYGNLIDDGGIKIVDLEMAGVGDIYFDLAAFFHFHNLNQEQRALFLAAYVDAPLSLEKLEQMRQAVHLRECLWALTQIKNGFTEPFYTRCSDSHLNALQAMHG